LAFPSKLDKRYELKEILGQGGMGIVYRALEKGELKRTVALKTLRDLPDAKALEMFHNECAILANLSHPNIVEIFDKGEFEEDGKRKPFFVMPFLRGATLDKLIESSSQRLTVARTVDIFSQVCKGLHAAHEQGLIHRDLKPSNIFVLADDSIKIIDFGIAHMLDVRQTLGRKGTLLYMSPEQMEGKPLSPLSDIFSLGVVCYEALTLRRPFTGSTEEEIIESILRHIPPPASSINGAVSTAIGRVLHKAMAKLPYYRFSTAREFSEVLQKALRNEPIDLFDESRFQPRFQKASKAFGQGDYQYAGEILGELEAEGYIDPSVSELRRQIDQSALQKTTSRLYESALRGFEENEFPLALQKVAEILQLDADNAQALTLKRKIESKRTEVKIEDWFRITRQHLDNHAYRHAREALQNVLHLRPNESRALHLLSEVDRPEHEHAKLREEKEQLYQAALRAWQNGEVSVALSSLSAVLELDQRAPDSSLANKAAPYQSLYNQVRSEHDTINNAYAEARKLLADHNFAKALEICNLYLSKYPSHALFQALKFDAEEQQRQDFSAYVAQVDRRVAEEPNLDRRISILQEALDRHPKEGHFERTVQLLRNRRDLVNQIVAKARLYEEQSHFNEALDQWEVLRNIYTQYPGIEFEIERVTKRREQQNRSRIKAGWVDQIDGCLVSGDYDRAASLLQNAQKDFPNDPELAPLEEMIRLRAERSAEAQKLLNLGQDLCEQAQYEEGLEALRKAHQLDETNPAITTALANTLAKRANEVVDKDWMFAQTLIEETLDIDPTHPRAKSLRPLVSDHKQDETVSRCISQARQLQASGNLEGAQAEVEHGLAAYPGDARLIQLRDLLTNEILEANQKRARRAHSEEMPPLPADREKQTQAENLKPLLQRAIATAAEHPNDPRFQSLVTEIEQRITDAEFGNRPGELESPAVPADKTSWQTIVDASRRPALRWIAGLSLPLVLLTVFLVRERPWVPKLGSLEVITNVDVFEVFLNGIKQTRVIQNKRMLIEQLEPREYAVRVARPGFQAIPDVRVSVSPRGLARQEFVLSPSPVMAVLSVEGAITGTEVYLDGEYLGETQQDGSFSSRTVPLGEHTIQLRREGCQPRSFLKVFAEAQTQLLNGSDVILDPQVLPPKPGGPTGTIEIKVTPASSRLTYSRVGEGQSYPINGPRLVLPEGMYVFSATAPEYQEFRQKVEVLPRQTRQLDVRLSLKKLPQYGMESWGPDVSWKAQDQWFLHRGGDFVLYRVRPIAGSIQFTGQVRKGRRLAWVVNYLDENNYFLFEIDKRAFSRTQYFRGSKIESIRKPHSAGDLGYFSIEINLRGTTLSHRLFDGKVWVSVDNLGNQPSLLATSRVDFTVGRFGFLIPGDDEIALSNFLFRPR